MNWLSLLELFWIWIMKEYLSALSPNELKNVKAILGIPCSLISKGQNTGCATVCDHTLSSELVPLLRNVIALPLTHWKNISRSISSYLGQALWCLISNFGYNVAFTWAIRNTLVKCCRTSLWKGQNKYRCFCGCVHLFFVLENCTCKTQNYTNALISYFLCRISIHKRHKHIISSCLFESRRSLRRKDFEQKDSNTWCSFKNSTKISFHPWKKQ